MGQLGLPPINVKAPWHGYSLGDWIDRWDVWADRAARGQWEETGRETLARQRTGLKPETPWRKVGVSSMSGRSRKSPIVGYFVSAHATVIR